MIVEGGGGGGARHCRRGWECRRGSYRLLSEELRRRGGGGRGRNDETIFSLNTREGPLYQSTP